MRGECLGPSTAATAATTTTSTTTAAAAAATAAAAAATTTAAAATTTSTTTAAAATTTIAEVNAETMHTTKGQIKLAKNNMYIPATIRRLIEVYTASLYHPSAEGEFEIHSESVHILSTKG